MEKILVIVFIFGWVTSNAQHSLEKIWQTDSIIAVPESVLPDFKKGILYISLIDGAGWAADGKGGIGRLDLSGKKYDSTWITGLNAPKGMGILGNRLYVADMSEIIVIDIPGGKIEKRIKPEGAQGLNDITIADNGTIYISDSRTARVWIMNNDVPSVYLDSMKGVNGLKAVGEDLIIASGKAFVKSNPQKQITKIAELPQGGDGIEPIGNGDYIVTSWSGYIFYVHADGKVETILETHQQKSNTADIGYDPVKRIVYVPTFNAKSVVAYLLK